MTGAISSSSSTQSQAETTRAASKAAVEAAFGKTLEEIQAAAMYWRRDWDEMTERMIGLGIIERKQHSTTPTPEPTTTPPVVMTREELLAAREASLGSGAGGVSPQVGSSPQGVVSDSTMLVALGATIEPASEVDAGSVSLTATLQCLWSQNWGPRKRKTRVRSVICRLVWLLSRRQRTLR